MSVFKVVVDIIESHQYWKVQNTGFTDGTSWFDTGGSIMYPNIFTNEKDAVDYCATSKKNLNQKSTLWRVANIIIEIYGDREITTMIWKNIT